jgi:hypothetical protein
VIFRQGSKQAEVDFAYIELSAVRLDASLQAYND